MSASAKDKTRRAIEPHSARLLEAIHTGARSVRESDLFPFRYPRTDAAAVNDRISDHVARAFQGVEGIVTIEPNKSLKLLVSNAVVLRFKKAGRNGLSSNIPTKAICDYHDPRIPFPDCPEAVKAEVVYELDKLTCEIVGVEVVARSGDMKLWQFTLDDGASPSLPFPLPVAPAPATEERRSRVSLKLGAVRKIGS